MINKRCGEYIPTCDGCGTELSEEFEFNDAVSAMKREGWRLIPPSEGVQDWYHLCPSCATGCDFDD